MAVDWGHVICASNSFSLACGLIVKIFKNLKMIPLSRWNQELSSRGLFLNGSFSMLFLVVVVILCSFIFLIGYSLWQNRRVLSSKCPI